MGLVDTHCHIQSAGRDIGERHTQELWQKSGLTGKQAAQRAAEEDVNKLICVGCDVADSQLAVEFVQSLDNCWASIGIHPHEASRYTDATQEVEAFHPSCNEQESSCHRRMRL